MNKLLKSYDFDEATIFHLNLAKKVILYNMELSSEIESKLGELKD